MRNKPPIDPPAPGSIWQHIERGTKYIIISCGDRETSRLEGRRRSNRGVLMRSEIYELIQPGWDVVYSPLPSSGSQSFETSPLGARPELHTRDLFEFLDGRFERIG